MLKLTQQEKMKLARSCPSITSVLTDDVKDKIARSIALIQSNGNFQKQIELSKSIDRNDITHELRMTIIPFIR
jgi:hypothetical protein